MKAPRSPAGDDSARPDVPASRRWPRRAWRKQGQARRHLARLHEVGQLLCASDGVAASFPSLVDRLSRWLPVRVALLMEGVDASGVPVPERPCLVAWHSSVGMESPPSQAVAHAAAAYAYLVGLERVTPPGRDAIEGVFKTGPARVPGTVTLPLVAKEGVLGVLHVESVGLGEDGLSLLDAVANLLAVALAKEHVLRREVRLRERAEALFFQAQEAVRWRDELLTVVSHDIKTPLLAVRMNAEMILNAGTAPEKEHRRRRYLENIVLAEQQMSSLIGNLLDRARLRGMPIPLTLQPLPVDALLAQALEVLRPLALEKGQVLTVALAPELPPVLADRERILQVLANLVSNAIKFTPPGGAIEVQARLVEGAKVGVFVKDSGPGIPAEDAPHLFERFWRASHSPGRGTGLGLSIAWSLVAAHGGTLNVESHEGQGSTFSFTLPVALP
ncbi:sensor histidine kinase [Myxococcus xanthus]|uniref:histidine kinase n=2 Tax=Myxococcus xanthus TaxID=34 RepID=A0AAE6G529_MYXXA|nr:HAMP domain-containing sensor histidine kinase [Myxococcus xanthus]QDE70860.1 histidine kinase [Myxococcus xanthus]QDE78139.1 histidine kinase [Myxococcus xanthus]QDE85524.1 histidine kinase [Myxococcus xanthus]QDE99683.1 histidine kinase [Myxococcus xanthus]QDF07412.1 histidine kinase [Myxococcus xanthus]